jgi:hypothetical protein
MIIRIKSYVLFLAVILAVIFFTAGCCFIPFDLQDKLSDIANKDDKTIENAELQEPDHDIFSGIPFNQKISSTAIPGQAIDVDVSGNYAYLTNDLGVLYIINIADKKTPYITGKCPGIDSANIIIVKEDTAYISYTEWVPAENDYYSECGFKIVDISDKENPVVIGDYNTGNKDKKSVFGLYIEGNHAFLNTSTYDGNKLDILEIIDISDKGNPVIESELILPGSPSNITVKGDFAYLNINYYDYAADDYTGKSDLVMINIKDIKNPLIVSKIEVPSNSWGIFADADSVYLSSNISEDDDYYNSRIQIVDISSGSPELMGNIDLPGGSWELDMVDGFLYVSDLTGGIYTINVSERSNPSIAGRLNTSGSSYDITLKGNYGYIADGFEGLVIIKLSTEDDDEIPDLIAGSNGNIIPHAAMDIYGDKVGDYYIKGTPLVFSALDSFDPEGRELSYVWDINNSIMIDEKVVDSIFSEPGYYQITLEVSDGQLTDNVLEEIHVADVNNPVLNTNPHNFKLEIGYIIKNNSNQSLSDVECFMRIPLTYEPYQYIENVSTNIPVSDEIYDNQWNKILKFDIDSDINHGDEISVSAFFDVTVNEFDYGNINPDLSYDENDPDLLYYTREDFYIDSENPVISEITENLIGNESSPLKIAEEIYEFIAQNLYYDYERAEDRNYEFMNASQILEKGSGVCSDYSILYTAMLRSAGIPARLAAGIPVYTILYEENKEIDIGHAWVEIKLPGCGWVPIDITTEEKFWTSNYFLNIVTERGPGYIYEHTTMDIGSYYYDGFDYSWEGEGVPDVEQEFIFRIEELDISSITKD